VLIHFNADSPIMSNRRIQHSSSLLDIGLRIADTVGIVGSVYLVAWFQGVDAASHGLLAAAAGVIVFSLVAEITGLYRSWHGVPGDQELLCSGITWLSTVPTLLLVGFLSGQLDAITTEMTRYGLLGWFVTAPLVMASFRATMRLIQHVLRAKGYNVRGFAIVGINDLGFELARKIESSPQLGLKLIGFYDDRPEDRLPQLPPDVGAKVGNIDRLIEQARTGEVHIIYITLPLRAEQRVKSVLTRLSDSTANVYLVPDFFVFELLNSRWTNIGGLPAVSIFENPFYGIDGVVKRVVDLVLGCVLLVLLAIPMLLVALAVKLTSRGPVFFRQKRYGLDGKPISVWKFRSMSVCENGAVVTQATKNDSRVTPLGAILRKTSLDELPQLFNVIEGSMSLVGPRPHANAHNEHYRKQIQGYMLRHKVKPGITGLAQVSGWRGETDTLEKMQKRIECDHAYIRDWSLWLDVKILFRTIFTVLSKQNAY
jgi:putative colanic acid biosynthesis UDP-glucose lipid carrier transferase